MWEGASRSPTAPLTGTSNLPNYKFFDNIPKDVGREGQKTEKEIDLDTNMVLIRYLSSELISERLRR